MTVTPAFSHLVVVGSSAGGIDALQTLAGTLPADFAAPIVIAQHLDPRRASHLAEILTRAGPLPAQVVEDRARLAPGVLYIVPPNHDVEISDGHVVTHPDHQRSPLPSVDLLFTTAAAAFGAQVIAVVLSGSGSDGAAGARDVKAADGMVIVEDPHSAAFGGMPGALPLALVDATLALADIGPLLVDVLAGGRAAANAAADADVDADVATPSLTRLLEQLRRHGEIDFTTYKPASVTRRVQRRMLAVGVSDLTQYLDYLEEQPAEYGRLAQSLLINVTEFFRDPALFDYLRHAVLPGLVDAARARGELRLWSAGCATGEEAYTLAMLVAEAVAHDRQLDVRIFASDADSDAIAFARRGLYPAAALERVPPDLRERYTTPTAAGRELRPEVRELVVFGQHDLGQRAPFPRMDLVTCRNVLIYFAPERQARALQLFAFALRPGGYLALGASETATALPDHFVVDNPVLRVYRRTEGGVTIARGSLGRVMPVPLPRVSGATFPRLPELPRLPPRLPGDDPLVAGLPIGIVTVDRRYDIGVINTAAQRLLGVYAPAAGDDVLHVARHAPLTLLRDAIDAAFRGEETLTAFDVAAADSLTGAALAVELRCYPGLLGVSAPEGTRAAAEQSSAPAGVDDLASTDALVTLVLLDVTATQAAQRQAAARVQELEMSQAEAALRVQRLGEANAALLAANAALQTRHAVLHAQAEALMVDAEVVQAAHEEAETLNEEMQATNEELETLNEELQATVEELNTTNDDLDARNAEYLALATRHEAQHAQLQAVLEHMGDAVAVLDATGAVQLANGVFAAWFGADGADFQLADAQGHRLTGAARLEQRVARGEGFMAEATQTGPDGARRWYEVIGRPLADTSDTPRGVLVVRDITDRSLRRLQDEFLALASHELRSPLTIIAGSLQMARRDRASTFSERARGQLETAARFTGVLAALVNDLLDATRLQTGQFTLALEPLDLRPLVAQTVEAAGVLAAQPPIQLTVPADPLLVACDPGRLQQVLMNLLVNAQVHAASGAAIEVNLRAEAEQAVLVVRDQGPGIPAADLERIFERFGRVERDRAEQRAGRGLGLGLYIARSLVTAHGGVITATATDGQGTTMTIQLPRVAETSVAPGLA